MANERRFEETLDPENWEDLKVLGHKMVDDMMDHLATVRQRPPFKPVNTEMMNAFMQPLPMDPPGGYRFRVWSLGMRRLRG